MRVGIHLCRGNFRGHWIGSGGYEPVAQKLFNGVDADVFLLEYDSERAGDFSPLRFLPSDKGVVLGLISSKTPRLEDEDFLKKRIEAAAKFVPLDRLALSPQCGFGTTVGGAPIGTIQVVMANVIEPAIKPLGYDWKMGIGLVGAFAAREVFVSTMAITYGAGDAENTQSLSAALRSDHYANGRPVWTPLVAVSLLDDHVRDHMIGAPLRLL